MKICIDPGHNDRGYDTGASGSKSREQDITYGIGTKLKEILAAKGFEVKMTRQKQGDCLGTSLNSSLQERVDISNAFGAEYFISIHCNSAGASSARGTETYVCAFGGTAEKLAKKVQARIVSRLGTADRGVKTGNFKVIRDTFCPAILVEAAFISNAADEELLLSRQQDFAQAIADGLMEHTGYEKGESDVSDTPLTVQQIKDVWIQEIYPPNLGFLRCDCPKNNVGISNYFNAGFFAQTGEGTIPVGNLADCGVVFSQARDNPGWINVAGKELTTLYVKNDGSFGIEKMDSLEGKDIKTAVSGIPIVINGRQVTMEEIKAEGYDGSELYDTWHGFLGYRGNDLVYVGAQCDYGQMAWILIALGVRNAIKLDGGGSYILHNGRTIKATSENRRINNVGMWHG